MNRFSLSIRGDNEPYPVDQNITLGRHLDNDIVLAGEDVFEYHARLELTPRGPALVELGGAVVLVNDKPIEGSTGLAPGDRISIGQYTLILVDDGASGSIENWKMKSLDTEQVIELANDVLIGRGEDCNLQINESHISREHACMTTTSSSVWLKDLRSSNGTFVNGDRVTGSWELFHGDEIFFDRSGYQLIAEAPDITPVVTHRGHFSEQQAILKANALATELKAAGTAEVPIEAMTDIPDRSALATGPCMEGLNESSRGVVVALEMGQFIVGRAPESDIYLPEPSVSLRHAEIDTRLDGCYLINLISTNGTWVNGEEIQTHRLKDGDKIAFGRVQFLFRDTPAIETTVSRPLAKLWRRLSNPAAIVLISVLLGVILLAILAFNL